MILGPYDLAAAVVFAILLFGVVIGLGGVARQIEALRIEMRRRSWDESYDHGSAEE